MRRLTSPHWKAAASLLGALILATPNAAEANSRLLNRLFNRSVPKLLFEGETALARRLVSERAPGGLIRDFRVSGEAIAFRRSFARGASMPGVNGVRALTAEEEAMREALTRIESRFIRILRSGKSVDEIALLKRLTEQELDARFLSKAAGTAKKKFFASSALGDTEAFFRELDDEAWSLYERIGQPGGLNGLKAPGADLTLIGSKQARVWAGIQARGADLRFAQAEIITSDAQGFFAGLDARPLNGRRTNMSFINASGSVMTHAQMQDVIAIGAEFRSIQAPGAIWDGIDLRFADLRGADLSGLRSWKGARWEGAIIDARTRLPGGMYPRQAVEDLGMVLDDAW